MLGFDHTKFHNLLNSLIFISDIRGNFALIRECSLNNVLSFNTEVPNNSVFKKSTS